MQKSLQQQALPMLAALYANKFGVEVILDPRATTEHTNGRSVVVPYIDFEDLKKQNISADQINLIKNAVFGWTAHGCMHVRLTDFKVVKYYPKDIDFGIFHNMVNIVEDCRIERECIRLYPGAEETLSALAEYILQKGLYSQQPSGDIKCDTLSFALYYLQSTYVRQYCLAPLSQLFGAHLERELGTTLFNEYKSLLDEVVMTTSTKDVVSLVKRIFKLFQDTQQQQSQPQQGQGKNQDNEKSEDDSQQTQQSQGSTGDKEGEGEAKANNASSQQDNSQTDNEEGSAEASLKGETSDNGGNANDQGDNSQDQSQNQSQSQSNKSQATKQSIDDLLNGQGFKEVDPLSAVGKQFDTLIDENNLENKVIMPKHKKLEANANENMHYANRMALVKQESAALRQRLLATLQSKGLANVSLKNSGKHLSRSRLASTAFGNTRVFLREDQVQMVNTAVHVILDLSGSMLDKDMVAKDAVLALGLALQGLKGTSLEVTAFGSKEKFHTFLTTNQRIEEMAGAIYSHKPNHSTPMAEALMYANYRMLQRKEPKKLLLVITDGRPNSSITTVQMLNEHKKNGHEVMGIGIGRETQQFMPDIFDDYCVIKHVNELRVNLLAALKGKISFN